MTNKHAAGNELELPAAEMLRQMFAATVHNIGNVITVASLALTELEETNSEKTQILSLIHDDILPNLQREVAAGTVGTFLTEHPTGKEYPSALSELIEHQLKIVRDQQETVEALTKKLDHIGEVIRLQQHMLAGLGRREEVAMIRLVDDALKLMSESIARHHVTLTCEHTDSPLLYVEAPIVIQVLVNLLKNAIEALDESPRPERRIWVRTGVTGEGDARVYCEVSDDGPGLSEAVMERLFQFGFTTKSQSKGGQGVGLHFCRETAEKLQGYLRAYNRDGGGARFVLALPPRQSGAK